MAIRSRTEGAHMVWVYLASVALGVIAGFMVGGSETPVASAAIPAVAGVVTATLAVISGRSAIGEFNQLLKDALGKAGDGQAASLKASADSLLDQTRRTARQVGIAALLFALAYASGITLGSWLRLSGRWGQLLAPLTAPWNAADTPLTFKAQSDWLVYQQGLKKAGVPDATLNDLFRAYEQAHVTASRKPVLPWLQQEDAESPTFSTISTWLAVEPTLAAAGMTDEQITAIWPSFVESLRAASSQPETGSGDPNPPSVPPGVGGQGPVTEVDTGLSVIPTPPLPAPPVLMELSPSNIDMLRELYGLELQESEFTMPEAVP